MICLLDFEEMSRRYVYSRGYDYSGDESILITYSYSISIIRKRFHLSLLPLPPIYGCIILIGKNQVHKGMVPLDLPHLSSQSCKAVWPLAIGNCKEDRYVSGIL